MVFSRQKRWRLVCNTLKSEIPQYNNLLIFSPSLSPDQSPPFFFITQHFTHCLVRDTSFCFFLSLFSSIVVSHFFRYEKKKDTVSTAWSSYPPFLLASPLLSSYLAVLRMTSQLSPLICTWTTHKSSAEKKTREKACPLLVFFSYPLTRRNLFSENVRRFDSSLIYILITDEPRILSNERRKREIWRRQHILVSSHVGIE
jgi:hypothetical protein